MIEKELLEIIDEMCNKSSEYNYSRMDWIKFRQQIQSQKNPITTAEGVKIGRKSRITPQVMPEKVLTQSSDNIFQKEIEADAKRLNEIYDKKVFHKKGCYCMYYDKNGRCIKCGVQIKEDKKQ
jgi:hypothetical protein